MGGSMRFEGQELADIAINADRAGEVLAAKEYYEAAGEFLEFAKASRRLADYLGSRVSRMPHASDVQRLRRLLSEMRGEVDD